MDVGGKVDTTVNKVVVTTPFGRVLSDCEVNVSGGGVEMDIEVGGVGGAVVGGCGVGGSETGREVHEVPKRVENDVDVKGTSTVNGT